MMKKLLYEFMDRHGLTILSLNEIYLHMVYGDGIYLIDSNPDEELSPGDVRFSDLVEEIMELDIEELPEELKNPEEALGRLDFLFQSRLRELSALKTPEEIGLVIFTREPGRISVFKFFRSRQVASWSRELRR